MLKITFGTNLPWFFSVSYLQSLIKLRRFPPPIAQSQPLNLTIGSVIEAVGVCLLGLIQGIAENPFQIAVRLKFILDHATTWIGFLNQCARQVVLIA